MAHYTVRSSSSTNKVFRICGYGLIGLLLLLLVPSQTKWIDLDDRWSHALGWTAEGLLFLGMIGFFVLMFEDSWNRVWQKVSFEVVANRIVRVMEGRANIEFPLDKISFIGESRIGLIVRGGDPLKGFVIPRTVEGFEQLRQLLNDHCEIRPVGNKKWLFFALPLVLMLALYALLFTATSTSLVLVAGAAALLFQGWGIFGMRKVWAKTKSPKLVVSALILSWLVLLWLVYQRFSSTLR